MDSDAIILEPISEPQPPRLRLHHLFALTAVMSFLLAVNSPHWNASYEGFTMPPPLKSALVITGVLYTVIASVAVTATAYAIYWQRQGLVLFHQPGHWLLAETAGATMLGLVPQSISHVVTAGYGGADLLANSEIMPFVVAGLMATFGLAIAGLIIALNIYIAHKKCDESRWSTVFYLKAVAALIPLIAHLLVLGFLMRAIYVDRREGQPRDALHRCGIVVQLAVIGVTFLMMGIMAAAVVHQFMNM